jgi:hypothetical protein
MSHDKSQGVIRPNSVPSPKALEKRVRRKLAHIGAALQINRPDSLAFKTHGACHATVAATGEVLFSGKSLVEIAIAVGAVADGEIVNGGSR